MLNALNERPETSLAPRIAQMQQALAPVRDALRERRATPSKLAELLAGDGRPRAAAGGARTTRFDRLEELSADGNAAARHAAGTGGSEGQSGAVAA